MGYVIAPPPQAAIAVLGTADRFPVRRIYCVGRNYAEHAREMGGDGREAPFFFAKPADAAWNPEAGHPVLPFPVATSDLHHEVELVVAVGARGARLDPRRAAALAWGCAVGVDLTRRDLQQVAKEKSRPWETAKGFDRSAPVGALRPLAGNPAPAAGRIALSVNGALRQEGDLSQMIWGVGEILSHLSGLFELLPGDLVFTGTPAGVGPIGRGDEVSCSVEGVGELRFSLSRD